MRERSIAGSFVWHLGSYRAQATTQDVLQVVLEHELVVLDAIERKLCREHLAHLRGRAGDDADPVPVLA
jgi:hypothetical protein